MLNVETKNIVWQRNKIIGIILAVFFGPWTWLYTYRRDPGKAAAGLGYSLSMLISLLLYMLQIKIHPPSGFDDSGGFIGMGALQALLFTWIAALGSSISEKKWQLSGIQNRERNVAICLALFLGPWTWIYTYKKDYRKYWFLVLAWLGGSIVLTFLPHEPSNPFLSFWSDSWFYVFMGIWLLALVVALIRKAEWYRTYGSSPAKAG